MPSACCSLLSLGIITHVRTPGLVQPRLLLYPAAHQLLTCVQCVTRVIRSLSSRTSRDMQSSAWLGTSVYTRSFDVGPRSEKRQEALKEGGADGSGTAGIEGSVRGLVPAFAGGFRYTNNKLGGGVSEGRHMRERQGGGGYVRCCLV